MGPVFEEGMRFRRVIGLFLVGSLGFLVYDCLYVVLVEPKTNLGAVALIKVLIVLIGAAVWRWSPVRSPSELRRTLMLSSAILPCYAATCIVTGGIGSVYGFGHSFFAVGTAVSGRPRKEIAWFELVVFLSFPLTLLGFALVMPSVRAQWLDFHQRGRFLSSLGFLAAMCLIGVEISHLLWSLRREVFESKRVGRYVLRKRIGRGGMGEVWSAWHVGLKCEVAVKFLHSQMHDEFAIKRFQLESRATAALNHPNTVKVLDAGVADDGQPYYAMELLSGKSLRALIEQQGPLSSQHAVRLVLQACKALGEAHARGIIHRDVKPENLFVCSVGGDEVVKVLDFGIAKWLSDQEGSTKLSSTGWLAGTPAYMSPEVVKGEAAGVGADVYAIGGVLYYVLTMTPPFMADHASAVLFAHVGSMVELPSVRANRSVHSELEKIILRCLSKSPADRYVDCRAVADALEQLLPSLGNDAPSHRLRPAPEVHTTALTNVTEATISLQKRP